MVDATAFVASVVVALSVFLPPGIKCQPTIHSPFENDTCSLLVDGCEFQNAEENMRLRIELESERRRRRALENVSYSQAEEIQRLKLQLEDERHRPDMMLTTTSSDCKCQQMNGELENERQRVESMENASYCPAEEIQRLLFQGEDEGRRQRWAETRTVTATFIHRLKAGYTHNGVTKVEDRIYILDDYRNSIKVYEDTNAFRLIKEIVLNGTAYLMDIVYSNNSKCVYISDAGHNGQGCIWAMTTTGEHSQTKWLTNVTEPYEHTLALSNDGRLLVLRGDRVDIYSLNAILIRTVHFNQDVKSPVHVVQTLAGNFILIHQQGPNYGGPFRLSHLTNDGHLINRYSGGNRGTLNHPKHLALDSEDANRLFVADSYNQRVLIFDIRTLNISHVLLSYEEKDYSTRYPLRLFYDANKKHLFVARRSGNATVYKIN